MSEVPQAFTAYIQRALHDALHANQPRQRNQARKNIIEAAKRFETKQNAPVIWEEVHKILLMAMGDLRLAGLQQFIELCPIPALQSWAFDRLLDIPQVDWVALPALFRAHISTIPDAVLEKYVEQNPN